MFRLHLYAAVQPLLAGVAQWTPGASLAPGLPCALHERWAKTEAKLGRFLPRECQSVSALEDEEWCCQTGLNCRPLHYQWSALPLSYGSNAGIRIGRHRALPSGPISATGLPAVQACMISQNEKIGAISGLLRPFSLKTIDLAPILVPFPRQLASWPPGWIRPILDFARSGPSRPLELPQSRGMLLPTAVWTRDG